MCPVPGHSTTLTVRVKTPNMILVPVPAAVFAPLPFKFYANKPILLYFQLQAVGIAVAVRDAPRFDHLHDAGRLLRRLLLRVSVDLPEYSDGRLRYGLHHDARLLPGARRRRYRRDCDDLPGTLQGID